MTKDIMGVEIRHLNLFRERLNSLGRGEQFKKIATMFIGAEYKMGSENFNECDCSGLLCSSLRGMGYNIRVTADELLNKGCVPFSAKNKAEKHDVKLMGLYDKKLKKYTHIGIVFHSPRQDTLLHSSYPTGVAFEDLKGAVDTYESIGFQVDFFIMDFSKIEKLDGESYGLDEDFR